MLEDRDYMRQSSARFRWSATLTLIVILFIAFLLELMDVIPGNMALSLDGIRSGYVWEFLSFQFLHGGWTHLIINCAVLYMFGREVEMALGKVRFLVLYFSSGIVGGLLQVFVSYLWPHYFPPYVPVLGASAGIAGLVAAFAMLFPDQILTMLFIPFGFRAKWLLVFDLAAAAIGMAFPKSGGNIAHAAHMGGILTGMAFISFGGQLRRTLWAPFESRRRKRELIKAVSIKVPQWPRAKENPSDLPEGEFISREVDPILDKISQHGMQSLTERERKILEHARNRMAKR